MKIIDLRSDTVTRPTQTMRAAMADAVVGDDVFGDDPTVNELQARSAQMLGTEAGLFVPSGTQCNLVALLSHCERGDEYIVGQQAHTYKYEGGGAAVLGSIQPQPLEFEADGTLDLESVASAIKPDDNHFAHTRLLC
ncbi:MAG: beta-eliminating lyase-related protein, partial [Acidiferrobacterales bacterium]